MRRCNEKSSDTRPRPKFQEAFVAERTAVQERNAGVGSKSRFAAVNQSSSAMKRRSCRSQCGPERQMTCHNHLPGSCCIYDVPTCLIHGDSVRALQSRASPVHVRNKQIVCATIESAAHQSN